VERVKWFRDRALRDRAVEEVETLTEEFGRTIKSFRNNSRIWQAIAETTAEEGQTGAAAESDAGWRAYAYKQAAMYGRFAAQCEEAWETLPALVLKDERAEEATAAEAAKSAQSALENDYSVRSLPVSLDTGGQSDGSFPAGILPRRPLEAVQLRDFLKRSLLGTTDWTKQTQD
jgi:hypothetical protein